MKKFLLKIFSCFLNIVPMKNIMIFESNPDFAESAKAVYEKAIEHGLDKKYKMIWIVWDKKKLKEEHPDVKFIAKHATNIFQKIEKAYYFTFAKYCFYTHIFVGFASHKRQVHYFLTHDAFATKNGIGLYWDGNMNSDIAVTSDKAGDVKVVLLGTDKGRMRITGLPRNDDIFIKDDSLQKLGLDKYNKVILWMPTFKHNKDTDRNDAINNDKSDFSMFTKEKLTPINDALKKNNSVIIIKLHPAQDLKYINQINLSNIKFMLDKDLFAKGIKLYTFMGQTDALITDFSTVFFDYLLTDKPIGFEHTDKEAYEKGIGFMLENPEQYMPGQKIHSLDDFIDFISNVCNDKDDYKEDRKRICDIVHKYKDNKSAERVLKSVSLI